MTQRQKLHAWDRYGGLAVVETYQSAPSYLRLIHPEEALAYYLTVHTQVLTLRMSDYDLRGEPTGWWCDIFNQSGSSQNIQIQDKDGAAITAGNIVVPGTMCRLRLDDSTTAAGTFRGMLRAIGPLPKLSV